MLIDGGGFFNGTFDVGKSILAPFLWQQGIRSVDIVVITHPHPDHLQGLLFILEHFLVHEVWTTADTIHSPQFTPFLETMRQRHIAQRIISDRSIPAQRSGANIIFLNPDHGDDPQPVGRNSVAVGTSDSGRLLQREETPLSPFVDLNERSLVMRLSYLNRHFLLPGDIGKSVESRLLKSGAPLASDVMFVPHHGSSGSSHPAFLDAVRPQIAIVSCGADNVFGIPRPELLQRYRQIGCRVYRTDLDGAVTVTTDGQSLRVESFRRAKP